MSARSRFEIQPLDAIYWDEQSAVDILVPNPASGRTANGIAYRVGKPSSGEMRVDVGAFQGFAGEGCVLDARNSATLVVEFAEPIAAVGAQIRTSAVGYSTTYMRAYDATGNLVAETWEDLGSGLGTIRYMGLLSSDANIRTVEYTNTAGSVSLGRVELRPAPLARDDQYNCFENSANSVVPLNVLRNDQFAESVELYEAPEHASFFKLFPDGTFIYRPLKNYNGPDRFTYRATGALGTIFSKPVTVHINVDPINTAPEFELVSLHKSDEDAGEQVVEAFATEYWAGAEDENEQLLEWIIENNNPALFTEQPSLDENGTLRYTAASNKSGMAEVSVRLKDDGGRNNGGRDTSDIKRFTIVVREVNDKPLLLPVMDKTVLEGSGLTMILAATDLDLDQTITYRIVSGPRWASLNAISGELIWIPTAEQVGKTHTFIVEAVDSQSGASDIETFDVRVVGINHAPKVEELPEQSATVGETLKLTLTATDSDRDDKLTFLLSSPVAGPTVNATTGEFSWTPGPEHAGQTITILVSVCDSGFPRMSALQTVTITVKPAKGKPQK